MWDDKKSCRNAHAFVCVDVDVGDDCHVSTFHVIITGMWNGERGDLNRNTRQDRGLLSKSFFYDNYKFDIARTLI